MKRSAIIFILLTSFIGATFWYGKSLSKISHMSKTQTFNQNIEEVWQLIFDYRDYPQWREDIYMIHKIPSKLEYDAWKEVDGDGNTTAFQLSEFNHGSHLTILEMDNKHKTSSTWKFKVIASEDKKSTHLTITEDRTISALLPRVIHNTISTKTKKIDSYLRSISNKFNNDSN